MNRSSILYLVFILTLVFAISCSGGNGNVTAPGPIDRDVVSDAQGGTLCMGLWQVVADKATGNVDVVQLRSADKVVNVLGFMEPPPLTSMDLDWDDLFIDWDNDLIDVGVILSHPIPDDVFTGFDVRGICFGPEVTNADGLTIVTGPEYFSGEPFGYMDGLLGAPDSFGNYTGLAGYKYFCGDLGEDDVVSDFFSDPANYALRGSFPAGGIVQRNYNLDWNGSGYDLLVFNYAIYANYDWPIGEEPWDVDDWSITAANSAEAFCASITETANSLWYSDSSGGGNISLQVEVWDWQGDITDVSIESLDGIVIPQTSFNATYPGTGLVSTYMYDFIDVPANPTSMGDLDILITVTDAQTFAESWFLDLLSTDNDMYGEQIYNCFIHAATVIECPIPTCESTDPGSGTDVVGVVTFTCTNLIAGASLGVTFSDGTNDWDGTSVNYVSATEMNAYIDLTGATVGDELDITITNGCGTEGTGPATWMVLGPISVVDPPNIDIIGSYGTPTDLACDPTNDRTAILYHTPNQWVRWDSNYATPNVMLLNETSYRPVSADCVSTNVMCYVDMFGTGNPSAWEYLNWVGGIDGTWRWSSSPNEPGGKVVANVQGTQEVWTLYDRSNFGVVFLNRQIGYGIGGFSVTYQAYSPFRDGTGDTGVVLANVIDGDMAISSGSDRDMYIMEDLPATNTAVVELWRLSASPTFQFAFGEDFLYEPIDITVDSSGNIYVLELNSDGDPIIWGFDSTGALIATSGVLDAAALSGDPLRMDADNQGSTDEIHVLHTDGLTKFRLG